MQDGKIPVPSVKRIVSMQVLQTAGYSEPSIDTIEAKEEEIDRFHLLVSSLLEVCT